MMSACNLRNQAGDKKGIYQSMKSTRPLKYIAIVQFAWALLASAWNVAGVVLLANGARSPGPTASLLAAFILVLIGIGLVAALSRSALAYGALSGVSTLMAAAAVYNALTADPSLWPSEFWRYAGMLLNGAGAAAGGFALFMLVRTKAS
jgi:hypothetical protein